MVAFASAAEMMLRPLFDHKAGLTTMKTSALSSVHGGVFPWAYKVMARRSVILTRAEEPFAFVLQAHRASLVRDWRL